MKKNEFQCGFCKGIFCKGNEEEALQEAEEIFGKPVKDWKKGEAVVVCDDCFNLMNPKNHPELVERAKKRI